MGDLLSYSEVARKLSCHPDTVRRMVKDGILPKPKYYRGLGLRFKAEDILRYIMLEEAADRPPPKRGKKGGNTE